MRVHVDTWPAGAGMSLSTCAVGVGWPGRMLVQRRLVFDAATARFEPSESGRQVRVMTAIDAEEFRETWHQRIESLR